ncbi:unnamed protein product [Rhizoctonia solani]|uniref:Uncharacterized protein n=1 Tax=Rhizoctonia solani TaxID=456999 RepID=A0A8H3GL66_9AGAM|nr:unnamed protein product [Rhizoctonia solani]
MGRTRDIEPFGAPNTTTQKSSPIPSSSYGGLVANGLKETWGVCNASIRSIEEYLPDDLKSFDPLLGPLIRCNDEIVTTLKHWTQRPPPTVSSDGRERQLGVQHASNFTQKLASISSSSGSSIFPGGGLVMDARELCKIWAGCAIGRFQLTSLQWFRDAVGARHEYLLFKLESGGNMSHSRKELWLRLERRPSAKEGKSKRKLMGSLFGQRTADDLITLAPQREDLLHLEDIPLGPQASVVFSEKLSLRYLVDVLDIIHKESLEYHIAGANCWFYASTIAEIVTTKARAVWELGDISYCDHWKSKHVVNSDQYTRIMNRVRQLREYYS